MHGDRGWLEEGITLGQSAVSDESLVRSQSDKPMHQGDKVHRIVRRLLFVTRATGAARDEQLGEHKTFLKASRWVYSRAASGRGAGCAWCPQTTRHTAKTQCGQLRERVSYALARAETTLTELRRERAPEAEADTARPRQDAAGTAAGDDRNVDFLPSNVISSHQEALFV